VRAKQCFCVMCLLCNRPPAQRRTRHRREHARHPHGAANVRPEGSRHPEQHAPLPGGARQRVHGIRGQAQREGVAECARVRGDERDAAAQPRRRRLRRGGRAAQPRRRRLRRGEHAIQHQARVDARPPGHGRDSQCAHRRGALNTCWAVPPRAVLEVQ